MRTDRPYLSVVINIDTRPENLRFGGENLKGVCSPDLRTDGIYNKLRFLEGFPDKEIIVYVDEHIELPESELKYIRSMADTVVLRKHTNENCYNDFNYIRALHMASGKYIMKFDADTVAFTSSPEPIQEMIDKLEEVPFVSYPSWWSPKPVIDESFGHRTWASTRFILCKRETLKLQELESYIIEPEFAYAKYGDSPRRCNWTEHFLTLMNGDICYYPPIQLERMAIFCWGSYDRFIYQRLNGMPYSEIKDYIISRGNIQYPNDVYAV